MPGVFAVLPSRIQVGNQDARRIPKAPLLGPPFCLTRERILRGFPAAAGGRSIRERSFSCPPTHCLSAWSRRGRGQRGEHGDGGAIFVWVPAPCASLSHPQETFSELTGRPHLTSTLKSPSWPRDPCRSPPSFPSLSSRGLQSQGSRTPGEPGAGVTVWESKLPTVCSGTHA